MAGGVCFAGGRFGLTSGAGREGTVDAGVFWMLGLWGAVQMETASSPC